MCGWLAALAIALVLLGLLRGLFRDDLSGPALIALALPVGTVGIIGYC